MASAAVRVLEPAMASLKSRSFELSLPQLTNVEAAALKHCAQMAARGEHVTQISIMGAIGSQNTTGGTSAGVLNRLETKGYIERRMYQRGVQVCIVATGQCTAEPACTVPHWRTITDRAPLPAIQHVRERDQSLASWIETTARSLGRDYLDFASELLRRGAQDYRAEQQEAHL